MSAESLVLESVKCGRKGCKKCPHGPYWYAYRKENGKTKKRYVGKVKPETFTDLEALERQLLEGKTCPRWFLCEVLGVLEKDSFTTIRKAYRKMVREYCPHSGAYNPMRYERARLAWDQLREGRR